jgi:hypothetical protein
MNPDQYPCELGKLLANYHTLEYLLRIFLYDRESTPPLPDPSRWYSHQVGDRLPVNALTGYEQLRVLIGRFNAYVEPKSPELSIDVAIVALRDALAHGRVSMPRDAGEMTLLKFGPERDGEVEVVFVERLTTEWMAKQRETIGRETWKVVEANRVYSFTR